jgi:HK97 family phage major capsid protein
VTNPYLVRRRADYDALRQGIEAIQSRAATEQRDLTPEELTSVRSQGEQAATLHAEITDLTAIQNRHADVAALATQVETDTAGQAQNRSGGEGVRVGTTTTRDRDPGHYRSETEGGQHSFFGDLLRSRMDGDQEAATRLTEHHRALTSSSAGTGILPPKWLTEYAGAARQTRRVADRVRKIGLGQDPRPITLPKQTAPTSVATQSSEGSATSFTDAFTSGVDTVTPATIVGGQKVSRQLLDAASPAIDELIYTDLMADYDSKVEARVVLSMVTAAGTATTAYATEAAYTTAVTVTATGVPFVKDLRKCATSVRNLRKLPADIVIAAVSRYGSWLDITDTQGRPLIPVAEYNPVNAAGTGSVASDGRILGMDIVATDGIAYQTYPESIVCARSQDTILFESGMLRFRYEEPDGPETIRLGVWGYVGVVTRYAGASTQRLQVTAA